MTSLVSLHRSAWVAATMVLAAAASAACDSDDGGGTCENHCSNGATDCGETGIDCGGECTACSDPCAGHCGNGAIDCGETGTDCGGECTACSDPCAGHCINGFQDCGETGIDCGGICPVCSDPCAGHCGNGAMDCGETGTDCGGECTACSDPCAGHCGNGAIDCGETGTDCGGECDPCGEPPAMLRGVNLAGADFGYDNLPGTYGTDYIYPTPEEVDYFTGKGMSAFRLPFRWERLQRSQLADFDAQELGRIDTFVDHATGRGAWVILDPHNYARYFGEVVGEGVPVEAYADFWSKLADHFKGNELVAFGLMNEPHDMSTERWRDDANAAIAAIRGTDASNLILVPGNGWTGAWAWLEGYYGTANAEVMGTIDDPLDNFVFEVHQYLDTDGSGTSGDCVSSTIGVERLTAFTGWLEDNGFRAYLGEFAGGANPTCTEALDGMLDYMDARPEQWMGWAWWAAGPWWGDYMFSIEPSGGEDRPQMALLEEHL